jgi:hypothetical protein
MLTVRMRMKEMRSGRRRMLKPVMHQANLQFLMAFAFVLPSSIVEKIKLSNEKPLV